MLFLKHLAHRIAKFHKFALNSNLHTMLQIMKIYGVPFFFMLCMYAAFSQQPTSQAARIPDTFPLLEAFTKSRSASNLLVADSASAMEWVSRLMGNNCFEISNAVVSGHPQSRGFFSNGQSSIGIDEGLVLATGSVNILPGPNTVSNGSGGFGTNTPNDPDLGKLTPVDQFDLALAEFDVIPIGNTLEFEYVLGSEEYCEYIVAPEYHDPLGIFISGPGISGSVNIATVPGESVPINIAQINHNTRSQYFVNNNNVGPCSNIEAHSPGDCQLDGWTKAMKASIQVIPGQTYHVKIALADIGDALHITAAFFKPQPPAEPTPVYIEKPNHFGPIVLLEACNSNKVRFRRAANSPDSTPITIRLLVSGSAIPGVDYSPLAQEYVIPAGQNFLDVQVDVFPNSFYNPEKTIVVQLLNTCSSAADTFFVRDYPAMSLNLPDMVLKTGEIIELTPALFGGVAPCTFLWNTNDTSTILFVTQPGMYTVTVSDACGNSVVASSEITNVHWGDTSCSNAVIACQLNGMTGSINPVANPGSSNLFCDSIALYPKQWFGFVADRTAFVIGVSTSNCQNGQGLQVALFDNCLAPMALVCHAGCAGCGNQTLSIPSDQYVPGRVYWLAIAGRDGDACDFKINLSSGNQVLPVPVPVTALAGPSRICPNTSAVFSLPDTLQVIRYHWSSPPGSSINGLSNDVSFPAPAGATATVSFAETSGPVCVRAEYACHSISPPICRDVIAQTGPPQLLPAVVICENDLPYVTPWGYEVYSSGLYQTTLMSSLGCDSMVVQQVSVQKPYTTTLPTQYICPGSCLLVCGVPYCDPGNYTLTCTSVHGCDSTLHFRVDFGQPVAKIIGPSLLSCGVDTLLLCNETTSIGYSVWTNLLGQVLGTGDSLLVTQPGTYILNVSIPSSDTPCFAADTFTISATPNTISVQATGGTLGCTINSIQLTATVMISNVQFSWSGPGGFSSAEQNPVVTMSGTYVLTVSNTFGCTGSATVSVNDIGPAPSAIAIGTTLTCLSPTATLSAFSNAPGATYYWTGPNNFHSTEQKPVVSQPGMYQLLVTAMNGCTKTATAVVQGQTDSVTLFPINGFVGCEPIATLLCDHNAVQPKFQWSGPNGFTSTEAMPTTTVPGIYFLTITDQATYCAGTTTLSVTENYDMPVIATVLVVHPADGQNNGSISIALSGAPGPFHFLWQRDGMNISLTTPDVYDLSPGLYRCITTAANGCTSEATWLLENTVAVTAPESTSRWTVRPNPNTGLFTLWCSVNCASTTRLQVYDIHGRLMLQQLEVEHQEAYPISLEHVPDGIYYLEIQGTGKSHWMRVVVKR